MVVEEGNIGWICALSCVLASRRTTPGYVPSSSPDTLHETADLRRHVIQITIGISTSTANGICFHNPRSCSLCRRTLGRGRAICDIHEHNPQTGSEVVVLVVGGRGQKEDGCPTTAGSEEECGRRW